MVQYHDYTSDEDERIDTFCNELSHSKWRCVCLLQHDHSFSNVLSFHFLQGKTSALSSGDRRDIHSLPLNISNRHRNEVISVVWSLNVSNVLQGLVTIQRVSPLCIVPEFTTPATTAPVYGTENVSFIKNSAG